MFYIKVQPNPENQTYTLLESVIIEGIKINAPFEWNGASVPRILWEEIGCPFDPRFMVPSMVHDFLYQFGEGYTRKKADKLFRKLLIANNVDEALAKSMYAGVRLGGKNYWKS